ISVTSISYNETKNYLDKYYYLVSIKRTKQFTQIFANFFLIISQDDKSKIDLDISVVSRIFCTLQSVLKLVQ
ncbi:25559_t:CDS:1, partial [Racocetra persica]